MRARESYRRVCLAGAECLRQAQVPDAELDARLLMEHVTGWDSAAWLMNRETVMPETMRQYYERLVERRAAREPLQYITGEQEFMGLAFRVTPDVLIPRQDTELLVEQALPLCAGKRVLDVCTGSGCVLIALAHYGRTAEAVGADISPAALTVAAENGEKHGVRAEWVRSDLLASVEGEFDVITANPPYITAGEMRTLMPEVGAHEPKLALFGGEDGLSLYRRLVPEAKKHLAAGTEAGGWLLVEIGCAQGEAVARLFSENGFRDVSVQKDYAGLDRVVKGHL